MIFQETRLRGAYRIELQRLEDERGFFARSWCRNEFLDHGLNAQLAQCNISFNRLKGTLRGMHYAAAPFDEAKLVRCTSGALYDVIIDLRRQSPTYRQHIGEVLSAANHKMLYVPEGFAHGFQTLEDNTEVFYQMSQFYSPGHARGVRYNDPAFGIHWMISEPVMTERDRDYPDFRG